MKPFIAFFICWATALCPLWGQGILSLAGSPPAAPGGGGGTNYTPYLVKQNFEPTGYDNSEAWGTSGAVDPDAAAIDGSTQSMRMNSTEEQMRAWKSITASTAVSVFSMVRFTTLPPVNGRIIELWNTGYTQEVGISYSGTGLRADTGSVGAAGAFTVTTGVTYYVWIEAQKGTGSNGVVRVFISLTSTKPGSPDINITTGDSTADMEFVTLGHSAAITSDVSYDHVRTKAGLSTFTDFPL
jgi:uncharacterized membrane protein